MDKFRSAHRIAMIIGLAMMASLPVYTSTVGVFERVTVQPPG